ncbi:MAG: LacI family DNA-binding transcriptional regulator [Spirochaetaceae bacterium]|nr:LacI family DNA-binding transcriptional regulator [Spirochaetaceae bacterium]
MRAKVKDVANKSGVSMATVSRVLNGNTRVNEKSKQRVLAAAKELDYLPNQAARSLVLKKSNILGIIVPNLENSFNSKLLATIEEEADREGYKIIICCIQENLEKEIKYVNLFRQMYIDGLIILNEKINSKSRKVLNSCEFPIVQASVLIKGLKNSISINVDNRKASCELVNYLIKNGHRDIAMITGNLVDQTSGQFRLDGYLQALKENDISVNENLIKSGNFTFDSGYKATKDILSKKEIPTAIFAACDEMAMGAASAALDLGYNVPNDISIVGFDNIESSRMYRPAITTIGQSTKIIGNLALMAILQSKNNAKTSIEFNNRQYPIIDNKIEIPYIFIERNSVKKF